jgi:hypothetical protein
MFKYKNLDKRIGIASSTAYFCGGFFLGFARTRVVGAFF